MYFDQFQFLNQLEQLFFKILSIWKKDKKNVGYFNFKIIKIFNKIAKHSYLFEELLHKINKINHLKKTENVVEHIQTILSILIL